MHWDWISAAIGYAVGCPLGAYIGVKTFIWCQRRALRASE